MHEAAERRGGAGIGRRHRAQRLGVAAGKHQTGTEIRYPEGNENVRRRRAAGDPEPQLQDAADSAEDRPHQDDPVDPDSACQPAGGKTADHVDHRHHHDVDAVKRRRHPHQHDQDDRCRG